MRRVFSSPDRKKFQKFFDARAVGIEFFLKLNSRLIGGCAEEAQWFSNFLTGN